MSGQPVTIFHLEIPLLVPFATASGRVVSRSIALVRLGGTPPFGWGEAAPYPGQDEQIDDVVRAARASEWTTPTLAAALDEATVDREARIAGVSLGEVIGASRDPLPISLAVGLSGSPIEHIERSIGERVRRFKLKIAPGHVDHVATIRERYPTVLIGVDANASFDVDTVHELAGLAGCDIAYLEQPVADLGSRAARLVSETVDIPVFADESVRSVADAQEVLALPTVEGVVIKPGRLGWSGSLAVRELAVAAGKEWRASGLLETGVGRAYTNLLAALPDASICDVAPASWFMEQDVVAPDLCDGYLPAPSGPGSGVDPDADVLDRYLVERIDSRTG